MARGVADAGASALSVPVADGGDGTLDVLLAAGPRPARVTMHTVTGPLGAPVHARLGWLDGERAVVELAEASGLRLLPGTGLDALHATSRGTGELIRSALELGARSVIVGLGGSASTDGGAGLLQGLGARLLDSDGQDLGAGGVALLQLDRIDLDGLDPRLGAVAVDVAVDVRTPLWGPAGAAAVFGPQKGASPGDVALLDRGLARLVEVAEHDPGRAALASLPGAGAAGGCGYGLALAGARLRPGAALVCDVVGLDAALAGAALVLTGEGRLDAQTVAGKAPYEVGRRARGRNLACVAIAATVVERLGDVFDGVIGLGEIAGDADTRVEAARWVRAAAALAVERHLA